MLGRWALVTLTTLVGCSSGGSNDGSGGAGNGAGGGQAGEPGAAGSSAGAGGGAGADSCVPLASDAECSEVSLPATEIVEQIVISEALPMPAGGPLVDGEYELEAHTRYRTMDIPGETPSLIRAALRLRESGTIMDYRFVEDTMPLPDSEATGFTAAVCSAGPLLSAVTSCPAEDEFSLGYTAVGDTLTLIEENEELRFRRR